MRLSLRMGEMPSLLDSWLPCSQLSYSSNAYA